MTDEDIKEVVTWANFLDVYAQSGIQAELLPTTCGHIAILMRKMLKELAETGLEGRGA